MHRPKHRFNIIIFVITFFIICGIMLTGIIKTHIYNNKTHVVTFDSDTLFTDTSTSTDVGVQASARSSTWTKVFDLNNEGLTESNYQAYTYDFNITNYTKDQVSTFTFVLTFSNPTFLASAWNGSLEIHQKDLNNPDKWIVDIVPDLREFHPENHLLNTFESDGESFIAMQAGDYLVYYPSNSMNAMEVPIQPEEGTVPGIILYTAIGENIEDSSLELTYTFHRTLSREPLVRIAICAISIWLIALIVELIIAEKIKKYQERHEHDKEIINESIETFTSFIDAKDSYTHGHSKRVAVYTRYIAKELGFSGDELDNIYYIALLHDVGKMGVPDHILTKPGKLTNEEFEIIKSHTTKGGEMLKRFKSLSNADQGALYHHERYDGTGYPEGRAGEDIPLIARIICVADSYDAMATDRVYRPKLNQAQIISELELNKGTQFDPQIADIMLDFILHEQTFSFQ